MRKEIDPKIQPQLPFPENEAAKNELEFPKQVKNTIRAALLANDEGVKAEEKNPKADKRTKRKKEIIDIINQLSEDEKNNLYLCPKDTPIERIKGGMVYAENPILVIKIANKKIKGYSAFKVADRVPVVYSQYGWRPRKYFRLHRGDQIGIKTSKTDYLPRKINLKNLDKIIDSQI
ncbi:MAG: hypothetical protein GX943_03650 [Candidatus Pacebacteria bacterium]|jgi:hypothetical protein|nr:hypothetical protein [Candidatus Paceibacterota bacterium]